MSVLKMLALRLFGFGLLSLVLMAFLFGGLIVTMTIRSVYEGWSSGREAMRPIGLGLLLLLIGASLLALMRVLVLHLPGFAFD